MKKCKSCKLLFEPKNSLQSACSLICAVDLSKKKEGKIALTKAIRIDKQEAKIRLKTLSTYKKDLQVEINKLIRLIDEGCNCISCGTIKGKVNAGHYYSVGARPSLRFNLMNIYNQCEHCNTHLSGNLIEYRANLVSLIGECHLGFLYDLNLMYKDLKLMQHEIYEAVIIAKKLNKEMQIANKSDKLPRTLEQRIELRKQFNNQINIY